MKPGFYIDGNDYLSKVQMGRPWFKRIRPNHPFFTVHFLYVYFKVNIYIVLIICQKDKFVSQEPLSGSGVLKRPIERKGERA
jgi:hypothetical protein